MAGVNDVNQYIQVDMEDAYRFTGLYLQGQSDDANWITSFRIYYSDDGTNWSLYIDSSGQFVSVPILTEFSLTMLCM